MHEFIRLCIGFSEVIGMAYRIDYEETDKHRSDNGRQPGLYARTAGFFLLFLLLTKLFWPAGEAKLHKILAPWDAEVTAQAFSDMVTDLRSGRDFTSAVTVFCREIIADAEAGN